VRHALPEPVADDAERIEKILELYAEDAIWEGVGSYEGQFGQAVGKDAIRKHFQAFWGQKKDPELLLNVHYLTSEQIHVNAECTHADGQWVHCQPWIFGDGSSLLRSSRLNNLFKKVDGCGRSRAPVPRMCSWHRWPPAGPTMCRPIRC
jgi:ketosteroid isomerase-like protein